METWNRPLGRPRPTWEDNIKMDLEGKGWEGEECIVLAWDRHMVRIYGRVNFRQKHNHNMAKMMVVFLTEIYPSL